MSCFKDWFKTKYKIIPVYNAEYDICGYTVMSKTVLGWWPVHVYQHTEDRLNPVDNVFKTYKEALTFLKHKTTILSDEEISNTERG